MPVGISATAEPRPTAANTAPNPAGPSPNWSLISMPIAGRPNCTIETAAWAMTAMTSVVRARGDITLNLALARSTVAKPARGRRALGLIRKPGSRWSLTPTALPIPCRHRPPRSHLDPCRRRRPDLPRRRRARLQGVASDLGVRHGRRDGGGDRRRHRGRAAPGRGRAPADGAERPVRRGRRPVGADRDGARQGQVAASHHRGACDGARGRLRPLQRGACAADQLRPLRRHAAVGRPAPGPHGLPRRRAPCRRARGRAAGQPAHARLPEPPQRPAVHPRAGAQRRRTRRCAVASGRLDRGGVTAHTGCTLPGMATAGLPDPTDEPQPEPSTISGVPLRPLYTPETTPIDYERDLGDPGRYPFTRGVYETMYRGKPWTMRQFAGFGTAEETNRRFRYLLEHGQTGLSTAFDMPTLMGYDSDHARSLGEVGREGVAVDTLADMEDLFRGIPLDRVTTSMTVNAPAAIVLAQYVCVAERQGVAAERLGGTIQADILKEYIAQKEWIFPPEPSMRLMIDMIEWCTRTMPRWHPVSISGYHIREAGATAAQELAFTLADGFAYVERSIERGLDVDEFAPRLSFFFNAHIDFFEEIAKYRAARRIWARELRERYGAKTDRALLMRFHTQTAGVSLTAQQPQVNIVRTAIEALAAVLGGTQSLHTNSYDEALALPTEGAARLALRTQQVIAHETGVVHAADPLGGSWLVESLTDELERQAYEYFDRIERLGGVVAALNENFFQREIAEASYRFQQEVESGQRSIVGVNAHTEGDEEPLELLHIPFEVEQRQVARLKAVRGERSQADVDRALAALQRAAEGEENVMPHLVDCARAYASEGEICDALRAVWGVYRETPVF